MAESRGSLIYIQGAFFNPKSMTPEDVASRWKEITDFDRKCDYPSTLNSTFERIMELREKANL